MRAEKKPLLSRDAGRSLTWSRPSVLWARSPRGFTGEYGDVGTKNWAWLVFGDPPNGGFLLWFPFQTTKKNSGSHCFETPEMVVSPFGFPFKQKKGVPSKKTESPTGWGFKKGVGLPRDPRELTPLIPASLKDSTI